MLFPLRRFVAWRGRIAAMLTLLLTISIVGQQLPCMHATTETAALHHATLQVAHESSPHAQHGATHASEQAPAHHPQQSPTPSSHHDPAAPGCAQLMACGLVVQSEATTVGVVSAVEGLREAPVGVPLAFTTAELEVESPPPRV